MEVRTFDKAVLAALVRARRSVGPVHRTERAAAERPGNRVRWDEWDHPDLEEVREVCGGALRASGLELIPIERSVRDVLVGVTFALVLVGADGEVEASEEWESTIQLDARDSPSSTLSALGAATLLEKHTLLDLLRPRVLPRGAKEEAELDAQVGEMPGWGKVEKPAAPALVRLTCGPRGEVVREAVVVEELEPEPEVTADDEIALKARVLAGARELGVSIEAVIRSAVAHGRRPLEIGDWRLVEAEIERLKSIRREQLAAAEVSHG